MKAIQANDHVLNIGDEVVDMTFCDMVFAITYSTVIITLNQKVHITGIKHVSIEQGPEITTDNVIMVNVKMSPKAELAK
jgi:hypothetical protein